MKDDLPPIEPADEEELRSAAALARALEGGPTEPDLPQAALETAALLRLSAGTDRLSEARRAQIRRELLESLPPVSRQRRRGHGWMRWLVLALPLAGAAVLSLLVLPRAPEPSARFERGALATADRGDSTAAAVRLEPSGTPGEGAARASEDETVGSAASDGRDLAARKWAEAPAEGATRFEGFERRSRAAVTLEPPAARGRGAIGNSALGAGKPAVPAGEPPRRQASLDSEAAAPPAALAPTVMEAPASEAALPTRDDDARRALTELGKKAESKRGVLLARVKNAELDRIHAQVDAAHGRSELERAQRSLSQAMDTLGDDWDPGDARLVRQDLYCRLAETALRLGQPESALEWVRRGLALDGPPTTFLAQLSALEGDAWAALGNDGRAAGSYMQALRVHEALLDESLDGR